MGFDDVSLVAFEEEPEPPRRPRRYRRTAVAIAATALSLGALVSGASAVTDSHGAKSSLSARQERSIVRSLPYMHHHNGLCHEYGPSAGY